MQHEWVRVRAKLDADEGHLLDHETGHEGNVAAQPIELGDDDRRLPVAAGLGQGGAQFAGRDRRRRERDACAHDAAPTEVHVPVDRVRRPERRRLAHHETARPR